MEPPVQPPSAQTLAPLPFVRGADPSDVPQEYRRLRDGERTERLVDGKGKPLYRLIPVERHDIDWEKVEQLPEPIYNALFGTFHPRVNGKLTTAPSATSYLTTDPDIPEQEAIDLVQARLAEYGIHKEFSNVEWPMLQDIMDIAGPGGGATAGGMAGFAMGMGTPASVPLALVGAGVGGVLGAQAARRTRADLTPSRILPDEQETPGPYMTGELAMGGAQGIMGEAFGHTLSLIRAGVRTLGKTALIRDIDLSPEQAALFAKGTPGGPFTQANELTGVNAYPRLSTYTTGALGDLDQYVSGALLARSGSKLHARRLNTNLGALVTDYMSQLEAQGQTATFGDVMTGLLGRMDANGRMIDPGILMGGARQVQRGMYDAADQLRAMAPTAGALDTDPLTRLLGRPGSQRTTTQEQVDAKVSNYLADLEQQNVKYATAHAEELQQGGLTIGQKADDARTLTERTIQTRRMEGEYTREVQGIPGDRTIDTTSASTTTAAKHDLPLEGWLHTLDIGTGAHTPQITMGRALQIRRAINTALNAERKLGAGADATQIRLMRQVENALDGIVDPALNAIDPNLSDMYKQAEKFTAQMYDTFRNDVIVNTTIKRLSTNPEEFGPLAADPRNTHVLKAIRDAFYFSGNVPAGIGVPSGLIGGRRIFDSVVMPEIRFQALKHYAFKPDQHDLLYQITGANHPIRDLIDARRVLKIEPGAFTQMRATMGDETYNMIMGGAKEGRIFTEIDKALIDAKESGKESLKIAAMVLQFTGISGILTGAELTRRGQAREGLIGMAAGGALLLTPAGINRMITDPRLFERVILGIRTGMQDSGTRRLLSNIASAASRELYRPFIDPAREEYEER